MKSIRNIIIASAAIFGLGSCDLLNPGDIINPNVSEDAFLNSEDAMKAWVNGTNKSFAEAVGSYSQLMEIMSDNYFNNYSMTSKVFDIPKILYTDIDVTNLQRHVGTLRESADYGLEKVAAADENTTDADLFNLYYVKAYSYILAGEYFTGLPEEEGGPVVGWKEHLGKAVEVLDQSLAYAADDSDKAFIHTLKARVYYRLGDAANAVTEAETALELDRNLLFQVTFDGINEVLNPAQEAIWGTWYQPLPRLDFLDPKYYKVLDTDECPINVAKAEENWLILAEAALASGDEDKTREYLGSLLELVKSRPVKTELNDQLEGRFNGGYKHYPDNSEYKVAASPEDEFRSGLVLDRKAPHLIEVPYVSGTSVTSEMIGQASGTDNLLELIYLMRQEIFFAEGRRVPDLGIRMPVCEVEAANTPSAADYTMAQIPDFIPLNQGMDEFVMDEDARTVVISHNMNRVIVKNRSSEYVVPFFN